MAALFADVARLSEVSIIRQRSRDRGTPRPIRLRSKLHLVLRAGDAVLDNLTDTIGPLQYRVAQERSPTDPDLWKAL